METITQSLWELHFQYLEQLLVALLPMALTVVIHGESIGLASRYFRRFGRRPAGSSRAGPHVLVLITIVAIMLAGLLVGGTFMVVTMVGMQEARSVAGAQATGLMAALTSAFALGQIFGPIVVSYVVAGGGFSAALLVAGAVLLLSAYELS